MPLRSYLDTRYITNTLKSVVSLFKSIDCLVKYLSSYSSDYNLIELVFGPDNLKRRLRSDNLDGESHGTRICSVARHYYIEILVFGLHQSFKYGVVNDKMPSLHFFLWDFEKKKKKKKNLENCEGLHRVHLSSILDVAAPAKGPR